MVTSSRAALTGLERPCPRCKFTIAVINEIRANLDRSLWTPLDVQDPTNSSEEKMGEVELMQRLLSLAKGKTDTERENAKLKKELENATNKLQAVLGKNPAVQYEYGNEFASGMGPTRVSVNRNHTEGMPAGLAHGSTASNGNNVLNGTLGEAFEINRRGKQVPRLTLRTPVTGEVAPTAPVVNCVAAPAIQSVVNGSATVSNNTLVHDMPATEQLPARRHARTDTPNAQEMKDIMMGLRTPIGFLPQNMRGLLNDYYKDIRVWVAHWCYSGNGLSLMKLDELTKLPIVDEILGTSHTMSERQAFFIDDKFRLAVVSAFLIKKITELTMAVDFIKTSDPKHEYIPMLDAIAQRWELTPMNEVASRLDILETEKKVYTDMKALRDHRLWRYDTASKHGWEVIDMIKPFLSLRGDELARFEGLRDLLVKGYRIGFRMRMSGEGHYVCWFPNGGIGFTNKSMVNAAQKVYGDIDVGFVQLRTQPDDFVVRFAEEPAVVKVVWNQEKQMMEAEFDHFASVHLMKKKAVKVAEKKVVKVAEKKESYNVPIGYEREMRRKGLRV